MKIPSKVKLIVFGNLDYPFGSAPTNRIHAYAKGIVEQHYNVIVISIGSSFRKKVDFDCEGVFEGVNYIYSSGNLYRNSNFFYRNYLKAMGFINGLFLIIKVKKTNQNFAILMFSTTFYNEIFLYILTRFLKVPIIRELNEVPLVLRKKVKNPVKLFLALKIRPKLYDGIIVISNYLERFYSSLIKKHTLSIQVPILVDLDRFPQKIKNTETQYIAYCGKPSGIKDGVPILLTAFSFISEKYDKLKLYIIGDDTRTNAIFNLKKQAKELNISDRVVFTGKVSRAEIPKYLCNASILALARPTSLQAEGGFPTKLGEYLASSNPVVVTKVGEIDSFLEDNQSAFISKPDSAEAFAEKLDEALSNPKLAKKVGQAGNMVAQLNFNYKTQANRIIGFINELNNKKHLE